MLLTVRLGVSDMAGEKKRKWFDPFVGIIIVISIVAVVVTVINFTEVRNSIDMYCDSKTAERNDVYSHHYVILTDGNENELWKDIYNYANEYANVNDAYVEKAGDNLIEEYSKAELMDMAILADVDGIIVEGDDSGELSMLIDRARDNDIPVVTVMTDSPESMRNSYVGISGYDIGLEFGERVVDLADEGGKEIHEIMILLSKGETSQNTMYLSLMERLSRDCNFDVDVRIIDSTTSFSADEAIRDVLINMNNVPDVMVCLSDGITKSAYQSLIEYNKVKGTYLLGVALSDEVFSAVRKGLVKCAISVDKKQMGINCVDALLEYENTGYVSEYIMVDTTLVNIENVGGLIYDKNKGSD